MFSYRYIHVHGLVKSGERLSQITFVLCGKTDVTHCQLLFPNPSQTQRIKSGTCDLQQYVYACKICAQLHTCILCRWYVYACKICAQLHTHVYFVCGTSMLYTDLFWRKCIHGCCTIHVCVWIVDWFQKISHTCTGTHCTKKCSKTTKHT